MSIFDTAHIIHSHTHPFNGPFSGTTQVSRYQKGGTNLDFTEARDCEWQWHQLGQMQVCTLLQTDNHASTPPLSFLQARCPAHIICVTILCTSVRLPLCLSHLAPQQRHLAGLLLRAQQAGDIDRQQRVPSSSSTALSSKCEQCHV